MSLAKSAETHEIKPSITPNQAPIEPPSGLGTHEFNGVDLGVYRLFGVEIGTVPTKDIAMLRDINTWAKSKVGEEGTTGDVLQKIAEVQRKLGVPDAGQRAFHKVWEYIKWQKVSDEAVKRQMAMMQPRLI